MLTAYQTQTQNLLQNPGSAAALLYSLAALTGYINTARSQIAGEGECVVNYASIALTTGTRQYLFSNVTLNTPDTGIQGIFKIRQALLTLGGGNVWLHPRSFPWLTLYGINNVVPPSGQTKSWAQYGQGETGSFFVDPLPDQNYSLMLDTVCYPEPLVDDTTPEAIPYPWTDAVPYYAAYQALLGAQRTQDADAMFKRYELFMQRARSISNPMLLAQNYSQNTDSTLPNKLGIQSSGGGG